MIFISCTFQNSWKNVQSAKHHNMLHDYEARFIFLLFDTQTTNIW